MVHTAFMKTTIKAVSRVKTQGAAYFLYYYRIDLIIELYEIYG
jgi:hypothetical protein